jgi:hypothetical protein
MTDNQTVVTEEDSVGVKIAWRAAPVVRQLAFGFGYWLLFLMLLQPGNLFKAAQAGVPLPFSEELLRIGGGALLGAAVTPLLLHLTRRFSIEGSRRWRHALLHTTNLLCLSLILVAVAQVLGGWVLAGRDPRLQAPLNQRIVADAPLLIFCMATLVAGAHALMFWRRAEQEAMLLARTRTRMHAVHAGAPRTYLTTVPVKTRRSTLLLPVEKIDWVETQGNYLALHVGPDTHLIRGTLAGFGSSLDPERFVRIHRTSLVAVDRVKEVSALSNGDASVRLHDGTELRLSRKYRAGAAAIFGRVIGEITASAPKYAQFMKFDRP